MAASPSSFGGIPCPKCKKLISFTEKEILPDWQVECPKCKTIFPLDGETIKKIQEIKKKDPLYRS